MKAMIFAAGLGTRLKPFTDNHPKALAVINGKTLLQRNIEYLIKYGITEIIINLHHFSDQVIKVIDSNNGFGAQISFSDESHMLLETGGGLKKASFFFKDHSPFVLMNVDILTDLNIHGMLNQHNISGALATLAVSERQTSRYFLFDDNKHLCGWRNIKTGKEIIARPSNNLIQKAFSGVHILSPGIFKYLEHYFGKDAPEKFSIVDPYLEITKKENILSFDHTGGKLIDVGKPESIAIAETLFE
ncbi:MAG: nucleotidyltransferase family protein [Ginsengibacter sp.]